MSIDPRRDLARRIFDTAHLTGEFLLRSGVTSNEYFDKYLFEAEPLLLREIAEAMAELVPANTEALAGLELGGIPLATVLSQVTGLPTIFVRKAAKPYGTRKIAEGGALAGRRLLIVEDVVTVGGQIRESAQVLRQAGAIVDHVVCVIDRESGGVANLAQDQLELRALFTMSDLKSTVS